MTDKKISELTSLTGANVSDANDVVAIVDSDQNTTKKITRAEFFKNVSSVDIDGGTIDGVTIGGASAGAATFTDVTASGTINLSGATVSNGGSVTTVDINGGTIDGTVIGGITSDVGVFTELSATIPDPSLLPIGTEVLWPSSNISNLPTDWSDTKLRLLTGASERAIISNIAIGYRANGFTPGLVFDFVDELYITDNAIDAFSDAITHTRASTATYVDSSGVLQTAASGEPRVGHHVWDGSAWVNEGLLHESEARTNSLPYSEDFTNAAWFGLNTATLAIDATGPDGGTSAVTLVDSGATGSGSVSLTETVTVATSTAYTFSVFAKADQLSWLSLQARNFTTPSDGQAFFNLSDGTVGNTNAGYTASVQDFGNGWYRCSITFTTDASDTSGALDIRAATADNNAACDLDGTSSILIYGAQLEAGPTPSSYIPTTGSAVTRAADVLTIPSANLPWPSPVVIGSELVTNGTFDTDTTGWSAQFGSISWEAGTLRLTEDGADGSSARAYQGITTEIGKVYRVTADVGAVSTGSALVVASTSTNIGGFPTTLSAGNETVELIFVAAATTTNILVSVQGTTARTADFDNISVREINPLAVSIQMDGRVTYADTDQFAEVYFWRWFNDANNQTYANLRTNQSANGGRVNFWQIDAGVADNVVSSDVYTPGVLVPYNLASRNGSTFINGAVDGTALTVDTTPVALPDLETEDLELGFDYMGTIRTFRVWANDIGDGGLSEASS